MTSPPFHRLRRLRRLPVARLITQSVYQLPSDTSQQSSAAQLALQHVTVTASRWLKDEAKNAVERQRVGRGGESQTDEAPT